MRVPALSAADLAPRSQKLPPSMPPLPFAGGGYPPAASARRNPRTAQKQNPAASANPIP